MSAEGHELVPLNLSQVESVETQKKVDLNAPTATTFRFPSEVKVLVIAGAQRPLLAPELEAIEDFLDRGGRLLALLDPMVNIGLDSILLSWGIMVDDTVIVDTNPMGQMMGLGAVTPLIVPVPETEHPITEGLGLTVFHTTRTVRVNEDAPRGWRWWRSCAVESPPGASQRLKTIPLNKLKMIFSRRLWLSSRKRHRRIHRWN